ncbi:hypothetical protein BDF19DRAFT_429006 [Syncephalis fuscata]|nr:hypothetical protein BDF19DRAFT_429006 [Syncephalis fuscata]
MQLENNNLLIMNSPNGGVDPDDQKTVPQLLNDVEFSTVLDNLLTSGPPPSSNIVFPYLHGAGRYLEKDPQPRPLLLVYIGALPSPQSCSSATSSADDSHSVDLLKDLNIEMSGTNAKLWSSTPSNNNDMDTSDSNALTPSAKDGPLFLNTALADQVLGYREKRGWHFRTILPFFQHQSRHFGGQTALWASLSDIVIYGSDQLDPNSMISRSKPYNTATNIDDSRDFVANCIIEAQKEFTSKMRIAIPDWEMRKTFIYKGETMQWAQQYKELITVNNNGKISPLYDMSKRETMSMYELAAPVEISPGIWFGHDDRSINAKTDCLPTGKGNYSIYGIEKKKEKTPSSRSSSKSSSDDISTPTDMETITTIIDPIQLSPPSKRPIQPSCPPSVHNSSNGRDTNSSNSHSKSQSQSSDGSSSSNNSEGDDKTYNSFFHHIIRIRPTAFPAVRADLEEHLTQQANHTIDKTITHYNPSVLYVTPWNPQHSATMITQLRDLVWYITRLIANNSCKTNYNNDTCDSYLPQQQQQVLLYYDFTDDSFLYMSSLALAYCIQRHRLSLAAACLRVNAASHVYLGSFCNVLQDFEDETWLHFEVERETKEVAKKNNHIYMEQEEENNQKKESLMPISTSWFFSREFEGNFPSRILPHLLLGDIAVANNIGLLRALGVTHILSVGIRPNHTDRALKFKYIDNIEDDGYGDLLNCFNDCNAFIDEAHANNGRVLVHCQVGTSRSATVAIAYVIHHQNISLLDAYFVVRARRLLLIIQPNLRLMYNLLEYEWQQQHSISLPWVDLSRGISLLNRAC